MDYLTGALGRCAVPRRRRRRRLPGRQRFAARDNISLPDFLLPLHCMGIQSRRTICAFIYFHLLLTHASHFKRGEVKTSTPFGVWRMTNGKELCFRQAWSTSCRRQQHASKRPTWTWTIRLTIRRAGRHSPARYRPPMDPSRRLRSSA